MAPNNATTTDGGSTFNHPAADIETIVVDPDDILELMRRVDRDRDQNRTHVLRVSTPLEGRKEASLHVSEAGTYYPPELSETPIHLGAGHFVGDSENPTHVPPEAAYPDRTQQARIAREDHGEGVDQETVDEYFETALELWEQHVRTGLNDEITVEAFDADGKVRTETVSVEYKSDD